MFYYIEGVVSILDQNLAVLDVGGVGYALNVSLNTMSHLETGKKARLYTYCNIKEDAFDIYGFYDMGEKRSFEMLLSVSGVGPKAAIAIMSCATPEGLALAIIEGNERVITAAPGVGKRIAQRIILELKDKVSKDSAALTASGAIPLSPLGAQNSKQSEAAAALSVLGFTPQEAGAVLKSIDVENLSVEDIIREALKRTVK